MFALSLSIIDSTRLLLNIREAYYTRLDAADLFGIESRQSRHLSVVYGSENTTEQWMFELREMRWDPS